MFISRKCGQKLKLWQKVCYISIWLVVTVYNSILQNHFYVKSGKLSQNLEFLDITLILKGGDRYENIDRNDRKCTLCNIDEIENEYRFILQCPIYETIRKQYIKKYYYRNNSVYKLLQLSSTQNIKELRGLGNFLIAANNTRDRLIVYIGPWSSKWYIYFLYMDNTHTYFIFYCLLFIVFIIVILYTCITWYPA